MKGTYLFLTQYHYIKIMIAKCIAVKYPRGSMVGDRSVIHSFIDRMNIQTTIRQLLFTDNYDYVLVMYNNTLYVCEKKSDVEYEKRQIFYHPLAELLTI